MIPEGSIPKIHKKRFYKQPDLALVVTKKTFSILKRDLESLISKGGVYYEVFDMANQEKSEKQVVVIFIDDSMLDLMAETMKMKSRLAEYDCRIEFKTFMREKFERFTGREVQGLLNELLKRDLDLDTLIKSKVVLDILYLHDADCQKSIEKGVSKYQYSLLWSLLWGRGWERNI